ncbi:MAG: hypothetical protein U1F56_11360 [Rubrivivax sp.]
MKWAIVVAAVLGLAGTAPAAAADAAATGYVVALQGHWTLQGQGRALAVGAALPLPAQLVVQAPLAGDRIVVVAARSGALLAERTCADGADCRAPLAVAAPAANAPAPSWAASLARVMARLESAPDRYVATLSRQEASLPDQALVPMDGRVDLAPALATLPAGRYELQLAGADCDAASGCGAPPQVVDWRPGQPLTWLAALPPGVHELRLRPAGRSAAPWRRARVLLLREGDAAARLAQLRDWSQAVRGWGDAVDAAARRSLLRALMDELAAAP